MDALLLMKYNNKTEKSWHVNEIIHKKALDEDLYIQIDDILYEKGWGSG